MQLGLSVPNQRHIGQETWCSSGSRAGHKSEITNKELKLESGTLSKVILPQVAGWWHVRRSKLRVSI